MPAAVERPRTQLLIVRACALEWSKQLRQIGCWIALISETYVLRLRRRRARRVVEGSSEVIP